MGTIFTYGYRSYIRTLYIQPANSAPPTPALCPSFSLAAMSDKPKSCRPPWESTAKRMSDSLPPLFRAKKGAQKDMGRDGGGSTAFAKGEFEHENILGKQGKRGRFPVFRPTVAAAAAATTTTGGEGGGGGGQVTFFLFFSMLWPFVTREGGRLPPSSSYSFLPLLPFLLLPCCDFCLLPDTLRTPKELCSTTVRAMHRGQYCVLASCEFPSMKHT